MIPVKAPTRWTLPSRLPQLEAVRGLAALSVCISHHLSLLPTSGRPGPYVTAGRLVRKLHYSPLYILFAAHEAVILFFVLSGFVLMLPWTKGDDLPYPAFIIRRWARIYIPYVCAVAIAAIMSIALRGPLPGLSDWANYPWSKPIDRPLLFEHLLLVGTFESGRLAPVFWTLVQEMRISLIFPLLAMFVMRGSGRLVLLAAFAVSLTTSVVVNHLSDATTQDVLSTLHYAALFTVGAVLAKYLGDLLSRWSKLRKPLRALTVAAAICFYVYGRCANQIMRPLGDWPVAAGVCVLFVVALSNNSFSTVLVSRAPQFLGRVSYSYYLLHTIVLLAVVHALYGRVPLVAILAVSIPLGLLAAYVSYRLIEIPAIRLGRSMSARFLTKPTNNLVRLG